MLNLRFKFVAFLALLGPTQASADWPAFLGGDQRDQQHVVLPLEWSESDGVLWKASLDPSYGQSSPVVVGDKVFLTAIRGPNKEHNLIYCMSLEDGTELWKFEFDNSLQVKNDAYTSRAAPTPVADSTGVYAFFESGDVVALNFEGKRIWQRNLCDDYGRYEGRFGLGGSVAQVDDRIFILADNEGPSYLIALDKKSGETLWKADRESRTAWSSPMVVQVGDKPQVVVSSAGPIDGYDPETGEKLWTYEGTGGNTVASPVPFGNGRFLVGASVGRDGENSGKARESNIALQVVPTESGYEPKLLWKAERATSSFGSPIVYQNRAYYVNREGAVFCLDAETGKPLFTARLEEPTWATPIGNGSHVFFFGQTGATTVIEAADEFKKVAVNRLYPKAANADGPGRFNAETQYGFALTESGVLVRTGSHLYLIGK